jgi:ribosomal protein L37AE/L43A
MDLPKELTQQVSNDNSKLSDLEQIILGKCPDCRRTSTLRCDEPVVVRCSGCGVRFEIGTYFAVRA